MNRPSLPAFVLILATACFAVLANNQALFQALTSRVELYSLQGAGFLVFLYGVLTTAVVLALLLWPRFLLKPLLIFALSLCGVLGYFSSELGVVFDMEMLRNVADNLIEANYLESTELMSFDLLRYLAIYALLPSILLLLFAVRKQSFKREVFTRGGSLLALIVCLVVVGALNYRFTAFTFRENAELRAQLVPTYAANSLIKYTQKQLAPARAFAQLGQDARQAKDAHTRVVGVMVTGETARADHFSLLGYARQTNPELGAQTDLISFSQVTACGTSTAYSVPCMFSFLDSESYTPEQAANQSNVLDVLQQAGINVLWLDNNSSCKGVCARVAQQNLNDDIDETSPYFAHGMLYDEALLERLDEQLAEIQGDVLIVLHTLGSHGPAYHKRYPGSFARFAPACKNDSPQSCTRDEVVNAYDNTILYTDHVLAELIDRLQARDKEQASFMLYASDHGESLGENGLYLHGVPNMFAPAEQTHVPMLAWLSPHYQQISGIDSEHMKRLAGAPRSHDNLSHSLLSLFGVHTTLYQADLDLFNQRGAMALRGSNELLGKR